MRKPIIAANWKMYKTYKEAKAYIKEVRYEVTGNVDVVVCAPAMFLGMLAEKTEHSKVAIAAQNMHFENEGAFTGETSPVQIKEARVGYVVIGHSERREMFNETDETVNKKVHAAFNHDLTPIMCCGESLEEREAGTTFDVVEKQVLAGMANLTAEQAADTVIAYEPIWAIGTGKTATAEDANEVCGHIRGVVAKAFGENTANAVRIQYGGSVKPETVDELMKQPHIDGALVGGASLIPSSFLEIVGGAERNV